MESAEPKACRQEGRCHILRSLARQVWLDHRCDDVHMRWGMCKAWWAAVHGVARSQTRLSDFTFTFYFHALEKEMAIHSSVLAWRILGTGEPGGLPSMGSNRVRHN